MKTLVQKFWAIICFTCVVFTANAAKHIYLSATGNDENNGLTAETAVKTLGKVHEIIGVGDIIHVSGIIDISKEAKSADGVVGGNVQQSGGLHNGGFYFKAGTWHNSKMIGEDPTQDGFTGAYDGRIFRIDGGTHTFENLLFTQGSDVVNDGGSGLWMRGSTNTFINCRFIGNRPNYDPDDFSKFINTNSEGGAVKISNGTTSFENCYFAENANTRGAALFIIGGTVNISGCVFEDHDLSTIGGSEGIIYTWTVNNPIITIDRCIFQNNTVLADGGAISMSNRTDRTENKTVMKILNSAFVKNAANRGGAFYYNNTKVGTVDTILIANSSFMGNIANSYGGCMFLGATQPNSEFTMANTSLISNYTNGNGGHGPGMNIYPSNTGNMTKRIYNSIFDSNYSVTQAIHSDLIVGLESGTTIADKGLSISNTFISVCLSGNGVTGNYISAENFPGNNINYTETKKIGEGESAYLVSEYNNASGIDDDPGYYLSQSEFPVYAIPLKDAAPARTFGNAACLTQFGIAATDQLGKARTIEGNACVVGATEATIAEIENEVFEDYPFWVAPSGIKEIAVNQPASVFDIQDGIVSLRDVPNAEIVLHHLTGAKVKSGINQLSISDLQRGIYIVGAKVNGKLLVQKILK